MRTATLSAALLLAAGCGDSLPDCKYASYEDLGDPVDVCTTEIDLEKGECFDAAQICPNRNVMNFCFQQVGAFEYPPITLQLTNFGREPLTISSVELEGDTSCAFSQIETDPAVGKAIPPGESMLVQLFYQPQDEGQDHVQLRVKSDAENFPELVIGGCGQGVAPGTDVSAMTCGEGGFVCQVPGSTEVVSCG